MGPKIGEKVIRSEMDFHKWFRNNYKILGYDEILKKDTGKFPDFKMRRGNEEVLVELETLSSHFFLHKHDQKKVHEVICIENDCSPDLFSVPVIEAPRLKFDPKIRRVSATIEPTTKKLLDNIMKSGKFRNKSHAIETAILNFWETKYKKEVVNE